MAQMVVTLPVLATAKAKVLMMEENPPVAKAAKVRQNQNLPVVPKAAKVMEENPGCGKGVHHAT